MNVCRQISRRSVENCKTNEGILSQTHQPKKKASKIKKAIKGAIVEVSKAIGKTFAAAVITTMIVIWTDVIGYANAIRPSFAIGGEWIFIIGVFCAAYYIISNTMSKNKKATQQK